MYASVSKRIQVYASLPMQVKVEWTSFWSRDKRPMSFPVDFMMNINLCEGHASLQ